MQAYVTLLLGVIVACSIAKTSAAKPPPCNVSAPSVNNCLPSCEIPCKTERCLYKCKECIIFARCTGTRRQGVLHSQRDVVGMFQPFPTGGQAHWHIATACGIALLSNVPRSCMLMPLTRLPPDALAAIHRIALPSLRKCHGVPC